MGFRETGREAGKSMKLLRECPVVGMDISSVETSCFIKRNLSFQQNVLIKYVLVPVVQNELPVLFYSVVDVSIVGCVNLQLNNNVSQNILSSSSELNVLCLGLRILADIKVFVLIIPPVQSELKNRFMHTLTRQVKMLRAACYIFADP
jgi:hypothetical protein